MKKIYRHYFFKLLVFFTVGFVLMFLSDLIFNIIDEKAIKDQIGKDNYYIIKYIILIFVGSIVFAILSKFIRGNSSLIKINEESKQHIILGIMLSLISAIIQVCVFAFLLKMKYIRIHGFFDNISIIGFVSIALNVFRTAVFEELGFRSFVFGVINDRYKNVAVAAIASSIIFMLIHIGANINFWGFINLFMLSIVFTQIVIISNTVIASIFAHFIWNFFHSVILSLKMYGGVYYPHLLNIEVSGNSYISGGELGLENSVVTSFFLITTMIILFNAIKIMRKKSNN